MNNNYKILVVSDSHGKKDYFNLLASSPAYDYIFYLGDGADRDLGSFVYDSRLKIVKGNCDDFFSDLPLGESVYLDNCKVFLCHGHEYKVKYGLEMLSSFAIKNGYNIVCFGHTHKQRHEELGGVHLINPGALKNGDYAEIDINNNAVKVCFKNILS